MSGKPHRGNAGYPRLIPMIGGFFTTIPSAVLGGAMTLMFSMIAIAE
ncbi:solute carrier family 23 protein [Escherichia coli]